MINFNIIIKVNLLLENIVGLVRSEIQLIPECSLMPFRIRIRRFRMFLGLLDPDPDPIV
jgi:hypothetical protein